ncbi:hypothetical protein [Bacillus sp. mrc49]|uniref:hypothetical protein n=1 Tax=Bacillus sp. mrc49 TaxID=2054913 RepID=UPI000C26F5AF|nr:hypothetical protein [Bacillus sp. mrc49]PJN88948.1 hypothetical protein CVN76_18545 [Bacillus sp. mrc49]
MSEHVKGELSLFTEYLMSLLFTACLAIFLSKFTDTFPWLAFIGISLGLAIIIFCWEKKKHQWPLFIIGLLLNTLVWSIVLNWSSFF